MVRLVLLSTVVLALAACDTTGNVIGPDDDFDPSAVDYDTVESLDYDAYVAPLLQARNAFAATATDVPGSGADYAYDALIESAWGETIVPFDGDGSLLVRLATDALADGVDAPYPNLGTLEADEVAYLRRWIEDGARGPDGEPAFADATRLLYVCNQLDGRVAIVDVDRMRTIRRVYFEDLGEPADAKPHHVVTTPDGSAWFVALIAGSDGGSVLRLSGDLSMDPADADYLLARETPPATASGTFEKPGMLALDPATDRLYAARSFSAAPTSNGVAQFSDLGTLAFEEVFTPNVHPHAIGVSPDGGTFYTAALEPTGESTEVYVYDASTNDLVQRLPVPGRLAFVQYAVSPDGGTVVLTAQTGGALYVFDAAAGQLALRTSVPTGDQPWHPTYAPDGETVYVPNRLSNTVSFVDPADGSVVRTVENVGDAGPLSQPHGSAITEDGRLLFISNRNLASTGDALYQAPVRFADDATDAQSNVTVIDTATGEIVDVIPQGMWASGLAYVATE